MSLAKIHIAKAQLGLDDDTYRALLARVAGVRSAKDLTKRQIGLVLGEFERLGWVPKVSTKRAKPRPSAERAALVGKIEAQLSEAGRQWAYADGMARRMYKVDQVEWCDTTQLKGLVAALAYNAKRHGRQV